MEKATVSSCSASLKAQSELISQATTEIECSARVELSAGAAFGVCIDIFHKCWCRNGLKVSISFLASIMRAQSRMCEKLQRALLLIPSPTDLWLLHWIPRDLKSELDSLRE